jgi:two-component system, chemotaxis family, CheB/CheR fusion protein
MKNNTNSLHNKSEFNAAKSKTVTSKLTKSTNSLNIIAVGGSAGSLDALLGFLSYLPPIQNTCILIAQHLSPAKQVMLVHLIKGVTTLDVYAGSAGQILEADHIYITTPDKGIEFIGEQIRLQQQDLRFNANFSIDVLFSSLAQNPSGKSVAVVLSGTGSDGATGIVSLKNAHGLILAQDPQSARFESMPLAAINTGLVDAIAHPENLGKLIEDYLCNPINTNPHIKPLNEGFMGSNGELQKGREGIHITFAELKATYEELENNELLLQKVKANRHALLHDEQGFILVDSAYRILDFNEKAVQVLSECKSQPFTHGDILIDFLPEGYIGGFVKHFGQANSENPWFEKKQFVPIKGDARWISVSYNPIIWENRQVTCISVELLDINEQRNPLSSVSFSDKLVSSVFNTALTGICITDEDGRYVDVNRSYCEIHGFTKEELIGRSFDLVVPKSSRSHINHMQRKFRETGKHRLFDAILLHKSGKLLSVSIFADQLFLPNGKKYTVTSIKDITEQKNTQKLLDEIQETAIIGAWEFDVATHSLSISPMIRKIYGLAEDEKLDVVNGLNYYKAGKNRNQMSMAFERCLLDGTPFDLELELFLERGEEKWIRSIGKSERVDDKITRVYGTLQDITSVKEMEYQMASVLNNIPGGVFRYKLEKDGSNSILLLNDGARTLWGLEPEAVMKDSQLVWDMIHPDDLPAISDSIRISAENLSRWSAEWRIVKPNGEIIWHQGSGNPRKTLDGGTIWDTIVLDITKDKLAEETLKRTNAELNKILESSLDVICSVDASGKFTSVSAASKTVFGYEPQELIGKNFISFVTEETKEKTENIAKQIMMGVSVSHFENEYRKKNNCRVPLLWSARWDEDERLMFAIARDATEVKEAQNQLVQNERLLNEAQLLAKMGSWNFEVKTSNLSWTDSLYGVFGVDKQKFLVTHDALIELVHPEDKELVRVTFVAALESGKSFNIEYKIKTPSGEKRVLEEFGYVEKDSTGNLTRLYGTTQNITERKQAELKIKESHERFIYATQATSDVIWDWDIFSGQVVWGENYHKVFGMLYDDTKNDVENVLARIHPEEEEDLLSHALSAIKSREINWRFEHLYLKSDGTYAHVSNKALIIRGEDGKAIRVIGAMQDITLQKQHVEQIRESNERFEIVTQATNDAIWDYNLITSELYQGEGFHTLFGYQPGIVNNGPEAWENKIHPDDRPRMQAYFRSLFENPKTTDIYSEYRHLRADGTYAYVIDRGIILRDKGGNIVRMIGATQDVTERNNYEASLIELNKKLETHAKELALSNTELEQFAYVASHDLQEPLRMVTSFLMQLEKKYKPQLDEKAHQYIEFAVDGAKRMRQIILDLLDFSRIGKHDDGLEDISLSKVVSEVIQLQGSLIDESAAQIQIEDLPTINTFRSPLVQVFQNLIGNALKYRSKNLPPRIGIKSVDSETEWILSIEDNGIGIEEEYFERIFIIFQRLHSKNEYSGTGMGLAIVKKIIENLGGRIWVTSKPGVGSTFYFTIPKNRSPATH